MAEERIAKLIVDWISWERRKRRCQDKRGWKEYEQQ